MSGKVRGNDSLCEKSMKVVVNIIKLSSFSLAKMSLGETGPSVVTKNLPSVTGSIKDAKEPLLPELPGSRKSQQVRSRSKPVSFVMQPDEGNGSSYVIHEDSIIDGKASDYIRKFHEKNNRFDAHVHETSKFSPSRPTRPIRAVK
ncbi:hypothetical protein JCGZ_11546 [Jatropha curcas]|uniref:Uncharacterized protein n=1 Tax=Jatropha curcas TaxID=180498 RepID=A0A067KFY9_JATCU|nr:hypothetical protein JCGZ_11546 [Jatropha curcas]